MARRGSPERRRDRCARRAPRGADRCSTSGPAAPTSRWRSSARADERGRGARDRRHRQPAGGPRRGRRGDDRPWPRRRAWSSTSATVARSPTPTARSTSPTPRWSSTISRPTRPSLLLREMARVARLGVVVNDLDRTRLGWIGAWLIGHLLTAEPVHAAGRAALGPAVVSRGRDEGLMRTAGLTPVRTVRGAFGQRYAIAAVPTPGRPGSGHAAGSAGSRGLRARPADASAGSASRRAGRHRDRRWRSGRGGPRGPARRRPAARSWSSSGRRSGTGEPAGSSRRRRRSPPCDAPASTRRRWRPSPDRSRRCASRRRPGTTFRLTYGTETGGEPAVGFDRSRLDPALLDLAVGAGADVRRGWHVTDADLRTRAARRSARRTADPPRSAPRSWSARTGCTRSSPARPVSRDRPGSTRASG